MNAILPRYSGTIGESVATRPSLEVVYDAA